MSDNLNSQIKLIASFSEAFVRLEAELARLQSIFYGEFDPGSGRTLAACLTHASRTMKLELAPVD